MVDSILLFSSCFLLSVGIVVGAIHWSTWSVGFHLSVHSNSLTHSLSHTGVVKCREKKTTKKKKEVDTHKEPNGAIDTQSLIHSPFEETAMT